MEALRLQARDDTLYTVLDTIETHLDKNDCSQDIKAEILIAAEEIYMNIAHYAYGGNEGEAVVQIDVCQNPKRCRVVFRDRGVPYNPLEKEEPDISLSATDREIGGLGIFMVKQSMDKVEYQYQDGCNVLTMEKFL